MYRRGTRANTKESEKRGAPSTYSLRITANRGKTFTCKEEL
jgi:hypothetical protein